MNILLIGSGGREHALAWRLAQSPSVDRLIAAPGNPGIARHARIVAIDIADHAAVVALCRAEAIDLVVIGPEAPLCAGLADDLRAAAVAVFGPDAAAARLEGSKAFTKALCARANIPTARWLRPQSAAEAIAALPRFGLPVVIKADGLAAGKGVVIAQTTAEAHAAINDLAGEPMLIEEFMHGEEVSLFALSDGVCVVPFGTAQDHKRVGDGDVGPNTGGMGAYSPARILTPALEARAMAEIVAPTVAALAAAGTPYVGVLYAGLMLTADGPKLVEYNCRFGDPECQVLMPRFVGDLGELCLAVATGRLGAIAAPQFADDSTLAIVIAAAGYPASPRAGGTIRGIDDAERDGAIVFQAGTALDGDALVATGGRVLAVTATAATVSAARERAYAAAARVDYADGFCRSDIGWREVGRETGGA